MVDVPGISGYASEAPVLLERYEARAFEDVQKLILPLLPPLPAKVLDIGAGTGRDAAGFARLGYAVFAVEPVAEMRAGAQKLHPEPNITWIDDGLPELSAVTALGTRFDFVLMNAVLMHLDLTMRTRALSVVASLINAGGQLAMSLRHGPVPEGRTMFDIGAAEILTTLAPFGFLPVQSAEMPSAEQEGVSWTRLVLKKR